MSAVNSIRFHKNLLCGDFFKYIIELVIQHALKCTFGVFQCASNHLCSDIGRPNEECIV